MADTPASWLTSPAEMMPLNAATQIEAKLAAALRANDAYLALAAPAAGEVAGQVRALTRQLNGLIRLTINAFDTLVDT